MRTVCSTARLGRVLALLLAMASGTVWGAVISVPAGGDLQAALNSATYGDVVQLEAGTYAGPIVFQGRMVTVQGQVDANGVPLSIINGGGGTYESVVAFCTNEGREIVLENVQITGGSSYWGSPGGIYIRDASPTIRNCLITGNSSPRGGGSGGGVGIFGGSPLITGCTVVGNYVENQGGGIYASGTSNLVITNCTIEANRAGGGGGLFIDTSTNVQVKNCLIRNNHAYNGNGIVFWRTTGQLVDCEVTNNRPDPNAISSRGGGVLDYRSSVVYSGNLFAANTATYGAALLLDGTQAIIRNNLLIGNAGADVLTGQDTEAAGQQSQILNNTFDLNSAAPDRGIIHGEGHDLLIGNNIIANSPAGKGIARSIATPMTIRYNCLFANAGGNYGDSVGDRTGYDGNLAVNPLFVDPGNGDYHLQSYVGHWTPNGFVRDARTSPCIDGGDPASDASREPGPNEGAIEMGRYGNTWQASLSSLIDTTTPGYQETNASRQAGVTITFSRVVDQQSLQDHLALYELGDVASASTRGAPVGGKTYWLVAGKKMRYVPDQPLAANKSYLVYIAPGVVRKNGKPYSGSGELEFATRTRPVVLSYSPEGIVAPGKRTPIRVVFDQPMHRASLYFGLQIEPWTNGVFKWEGPNVVRFVPNEPWKPGTTYQVVLRGNKVRNVQGETLGCTIAWHFTVPARAVLTLTATAASVPNGSTQLTVHLSSAAEVGVRILNLAGREVACLSLQKLEAGTSTLLWNGLSATGTRVPAGTYLATVQANTPDGCAVRCLTTFRR